MPTFKGTSYATDALACDALVSDYATASGCNPTATQAEKMNATAAALGPIIAKDYASDDATVRAWATNAAVEAAVTRWKAANP